MKAKILELMQHEGLKPGQLAELLDISPAIISHVLSERNKPSLDLLCKILRRFPQINPDWLLLDDPNMYRSSTAAGCKASGLQRTPGIASENAASDKEASMPQNISSGFQGGLFDITGVVSASQGGNGTGASAAAGTSMKQDQLPGAATYGQNTGVGRSATGSGNETNSAPILRVVICYADGTFEDYRPRLR